MTQWWPWGRHQTPPQQLGGAAAAEAAREGLAQEKVRSSEVREVSQELREHRERNHFAQMLEESMRVAPRRGWLHRHGRSS